MFQHYKKLFLDLLFPPSCLGCGLSDTWLCDECFSIIMPGSHQVCYICRQPSSSAETCPAHIGIKELNRLFVAAHFGVNPLLRKAIYHLKYKKDPEEIADRLGLFLGNILPSEKPLIVIPVPLHKEREKERGYNQAKFLAESVVKHSRLSMMLDTQLLIRTKPTLSQVDVKSRNHRIKNLEDAFFAKGSITPDATYLLIDDIVTTGATFENCCKALRQAGAKEVFGAVLARN